MSAKDKAKELVDKFIPHAKYWDCYNDVSLDENHAKQCALIAVDEILTGTDLTSYSGKFDFWNEVKQEINNL